MDAQERITAAVIGPMLIGVGLLLAFLVTLLWSTAPLILALGGTLVIGPLSAIAIVLGVSAIWLAIFGDD